MEFYGNFQKLLSNCISNDLTNNMIEQTKDLVKSQKFQLMQAFKIGDMSKVNNLVKGKGFAKAFKMQGQRALNLATTFNTPSFNMGKFTSLGNNMRNQMKNLTKFKSKSSTMQLVQSLQTKKMSAELLITKLKRQAQDLGI